MSIRFGLLETPARVRPASDAIRAGAFDPAYCRTGSDQPIRNESVHPAGSRCAWLSPLPEFACLRWSFGGREQARPSCCDGGACDAQPPHPRGGSIILRAM